MEVDSAQLLAERLVREERVIDVQLWQQVDQLLCLFPVRLRRECPLGCLELALATGHCASSARIPPRQNESAGKPRSGKTTKGQR